MTTSEHRHDQDEQQETSNSDLVKHQRRQRLMELTDRRDRLARIAAEREAHELPDAAEYQHELGVIEEALARRYPDVWEQQFATWALRDARRIHTPDRPSIYCGICRAFGIGIPPTAA